MVQNGTGDGVFGLLLQCLGDSKGLSFVQTACGQHTADGKLPFGQRTGFIEHDVVNLGKRFQALFAADKNAVFGKRTGRSGQRGRRGKRQGTRAGNDQQGNGNPQSSVRVGIPCPADKNRNRKQKFAKHKTGRVFFGQLGGTRFLRQRTVEQFDDMGQARVAAGMVGADD